MTPTIIPITEARKNLGNLSEEVSSNKYIILTKGGKAQSALVNIAYLNRLQEEVRKLYQKTFIDPNLLPFTRLFKKEEINKWLKEDMI